MKKAFNQKVISKLKFYVYVLTKIVDGKEEIFYIGKGKGNRVFNHFEDANKINLSEEKNISEKHKNIIHEECKAYIVAAELSSKEALKYESLLISIFKEFPSYNLSNLMQGHHPYGVINVDAINKKYSTPIDLEEYCQKNKIKILTLKTNQEQYYSARDKDFRGSLEGIWKLDDKNFNSVDYVVGVNKGTIYGIYKPIKGSLKNTDDMTQAEWDHWNTSHFLMGRPEEFVFKTDKNVEDIRGKKVFKLNTIKTQPSQLIQTSTALTKRDEKISEDLMNRFVEDKKIKGQSGRYYFGFTKNKK